MGNEIVPTMQDIQSMMSVNPLAKEQVVGFAKDRRIAEMETVIKDLTEQLASKGESDQ